MRGQFLRKVGCGFALLILFAAGMLSAMIWVVVSTLGVVQLPDGAQAIMRLVSSLALVSGLVIILLSAFILRRTALPLGDLMEAVGRIADGDYSVRMREGGPFGMRRLAQRFNTMAQRLEREGEQRRNRLAEVAHELRTPITVLQGNLEGILDGIYPADQERLKSILEETRVLSRIIDDLRTLSLAESSALHLQFEPTELYELIDNVVASFKGQADAAGIAVLVELLPDLPLLEIDPTRVREVLANLLSNALYYTPRGGRVELRAWIEEDDRDRVRVSVSDTGAGISAEDLPHIFDRFYKSEDSPGTGLGLAIARSLVAAHDGEIIAESEPGLGTRICFMLPVMGERDRQ